MSGSEVPYRSVTAKLRDDDSLDDVARYLKQVLPDAWCAAYTHMTEGNAEIVQVTDQGYEFLFDLACERVVAAFGLSRTSAVPRDRARMRGFLNRSSARTVAGSAASDLAQLSWRERFLRTHGDEYDRGHFISHLQGGGLDINLFPQLAEVNRGHSPEGREYRSMERWAAANPGTFCFSRPLYTDDTWVPDLLEYGIQITPTELKVRVFPNRPSPERTSMRA